LRNWRRASLRPKRTVRDQASRRSLGESLSPI
jgi:hypothetical protein